MLKALVRKSQRHCLYLVYRQEFLELVQTQQSQRAFAFLVKRLKPLEVRCGAASSFFETGLNVRHISATPRARIDRAT